MKLLAVISIALIKSYFDAHPNEQQIHFTSDGYAWLDKNVNQMEAHIGTLKDKEVTTITRAEAKAMKEEKPESAKGTVTEPLEFNEEAKRKEYAKLTKAELQDNLQARGISFDEKATNAALIELLIASDKNAQGKGEA